MKNRLEYFSKSPIEGDIIEIVGLYPEMEWYLCGIRNNRGWNGEEGGIFSNKDIILSENAKHYKHFWYIEDIEIYENCEKIDFYEIDI